MSDADATLAGALTAALAELALVETDARAEVQTRAGGTYVYGYATLGAVVKATRPVLAAHGLVALTPVTDWPDGGLAVTVRLIHRSGAELNLGSLPFPPGPDPQATGTTITYHRRYALLAALGMAAGDDDDGRQHTPPSRGSTPRGGVAALRAELLARIAELPTDEDRAALADWMRAEDLPAVKRITVPQGQRLLAHLDHLTNPEPEPVVEG